MVRYAADKKLANTFSQFDTPHITRKHNFQTPECKRRQCKTSKLPNNCRSTFSIFICSIYFRRVIQGKVNLPKKSTKEKPLGIA